MEPYSPDCCGNSSYTRCSSKSNFRLLFSPKHKDDHVLICLSQLAQAVDFYLSPASKDHLPQIQKLAQKPSASETDAQLLGYALEAVRLSGFNTSREASASATIQEDDGRRVNIRTGDRVLISIVRVTSVLLFFSPQTFLYHTLC